MPDQPPSILSETAMTFAAAVERLQRDNGELLNSKSTMEKEIVDLRARLDMKERECDVALSQRDYYQNFATTLVTHLHTVESIIIEAISSARTATGIGRQPTLPAEDQKRLEKLAEALKPQEVTQHIDGAPQHEQ